MTTSLVICDSCDTGFFIYNQETCISGVCGDGILTVFKECDPLLEGIIKCSQECLSNLDTSECSQGVCKRNIFELVAVDSETLALAIRERYRVLVKYSLATNSVVIATVDTKSYLICPLFFEIFNDGKTTCYYESSDGLIYFQTSKNIMGLLSKRLIEKMNPGLLRVERLAQIPTVFLDYNEQITISIDSTLLGFDVQLFYPPKASVQRDLMFSYLNKRDEFEIRTTEWKCTSFRDRETQIEDTDSKLKINELLANIASKQVILPKQLLLAGANIEIALTVTESSGVVIEKSFAVELLDYPIVISLRTYNDSIIFFSTTNTISVVLNYPTNMAINTSLIKIKDAESVYLYGDFFIDDVKDIPGTIIISFTPKEVNSCILELSYNQDEQEVLIELIHSISNSYTHIVHPRIASVDSPIPIFMSLHSDQTAKVKCLRVSDLAECEPGLNDLSYVGFQFNLGVDFTSPGNNYLIFEIWDTDGSFAIRTSEIMIVADAIITFDDTILLGLTYRDGSDLQSSTELIRFGVFHHNVTLVESVDMQIAFIDEQGYQINELTGISTEIKYNHFIETSPPIRDSDSKSISHGRFDLSISGEGDTQSYRILFFTYNTPSIWPTIKHVDSVDKKNAYFEITISRESSVNIYGGLAPTQFKYYLLVHYSVTHNTHIPPIFLVGVDDVSVLKLSPLSIMNIDKIEVSISCFDGNHYFLADSEAIVDQLKIPNMGSVPEYHIDNMKTLNSQPDLISKMNIFNRIAFELNQADLVCRYMEACLSDLKSSQDVRLATIQLFFEEWGKINDKNETFAESEFYLLKSSFMQAISVNYTYLPTQAIKSIYYDVVNDTDYLKGRILHLINTSNSRTEFEFVERMKPYPQLTLYNLNIMLGIHANYIYHLASVSELPEDDQEALNRVLEEPFLQIKIINEIKLKRYAFSNYPLSNQNQGFIVGGATIYRSIGKRDYFFEFGQEVAIELKNIELLDEYV